MSRPERNDPCPCGSGKKFKKCCLNNSNAQQVSSAQSAKNTPANRTAPTPAEINQLVALFNAGRHVELENRAHLLIEQHPNSGVVWKALSISLQAQGKEALPALQKTTELSPGDAEAHTNLAIVLRDLGRFDDAVASCRRALEIKPDFAEAHNNLGNALLGIGQPAGAVASYRRALEIKPDSPMRTTTWATPCKTSGNLTERWQATAGRWRSNPISPGRTATWAKPCKTLGNSTARRRAIAGRRNSNPTPFNTPSTPI